MMSPHGQVVSLRITPVWRDFSDFEHLSRDLAIYLANTAGSIVQPSVARRILPKRADDTNYGAPGCGTRPRMLRRAGRTVLYGAVELQKTGAGPRYAVTSSQLKHRTWWRLSQQPARREDDRRQ